jgi:hypothetical protein
VLHAGMTFPALYRAFVALACGLLCALDAVLAQLDFKSDVVLWNSIACRFPTAHRPSRFIEGNRSYFRPSTCQVQKAGWIRMGECYPKVPHKCQELNFWTKLAKFYAPSLNCPSKVSNQSKIWRLAFPIVLIALLIGTTVGVLWHQHATSSPDTCPICHFSHQAIEPALATARLSVLIATGPAPEPPHLRFTAANPARHVPARAPPA